MTKTSKIVLGILGAAAAGVAIGVLLAPEKGSDTRKKIKQTSAEWAECVTDLFTKAKDKAVNKFKKSKDFANA